MPGMLRSKVRSNASSIKPVVTLSGPMPTMKSSTYLMRFAHRGDGSVRRDNFGEQFRQIAAHLESAFFVQDLPSAAVFLSFLRMLIASAAVDIRVPPSM